MAHDLEEQLARLEAEGTAAIDGAEDADQLERLRLELLGRKGRLTGILRGLGQLPGDARPRIGAEANRIKQALTERIDARQSALGGAAESSAAEDLTLPGRARWRGGKHPVTLVVDEICEIFRDLGFARVRGPEVETVDYNFVKLNTPLDHPAVDMHDTFYLRDGVVLRTHTSPVQARIMEMYPPPVRVVVPGMVYRRDP